MDFENQGYVLDKPLPTVLPEGSSPEEHLTFNKWLEDNRKVRSIILASMTTEIQKQYDRLDDVPSIMLRMKEVYAVPARHIRYAATKAFFGTKMAEGSSVQSHGVKMLYFVENLEDPKVGLENDTYKDERLRPPRRKARGPDAGRGRRARERLSQPLLAPEALLLPRRERAIGRLGVLSGREQMICACIANERSIGRESVHNSSPTQVLERSRKLSKDQMVLRLGEGKAVVVEAVGSLSLVISDHIRIILKSNLIMTVQHKRKVDDHENTQIWHARLGHISKGRIRKLVDSKNLEIDDLDHLSTCDSCLKGKMTKKPIIGQRAISNGVLDLIHIEVCGPLSTPARGGFSYFITFTDDHSRYGYVYQMSYKSEAFGRFKKYRLKVENQTGHKIKFSRTETVPQTPYEIWKGKPASYKYLRVWGSPAYIKRLVGDKLDSRSSLCRFIEYPKETGVYYFYDPAEQKIFISRNAVFLKKGFPSDSQPDDVLIEESSEEPHHDSTISFEPPVHTDGVTVRKDDLEANGIGPHVI
ncbi:UNVERIFIED_CONTAM: hypothetical protein Slati_1697000 [Sesamum latifolium]|uniref:GAG-pre-integrase domain-containing protein n=1 Tax=Sesamum latifolium TaxID=2727402 RepID=A0AAW2X0Q3_9LAMI